MVSKIIRISGDMQYLTGGNCRYWYSGIFPQIICKSKLSAIFKFWFSDIYCSMKKICFLLIVLACCSFGKGQLVYSLDDDRDYIANLEKEAKQASSDSVKAYLYLRISSLYRLVNDTSKVNDYLAKGIGLSEPYPFLKAASWYYKAQPLYAKREIPLIEKYFYTGDSLLEAFTDKEAYKIRGYIWHAYGSFQQIKGSEKDAMDAFINKALPFANKSQDPFLIGNVNKATGIVFMNANQREKAIAYLETAAKEVAKSPADNPTRLETLCEIYIISAENYCELESLDSARLNLDNAWQMLKDKPNSNLNLTYFYAEGVYHRKLKQYDKAIMSFDKVIALGRNVPVAQFSVNRALYAKFKSLRLSNQYGPAINVMQQLLTSPLVFTTDKKTYYKEMSDVYAAMGNKAEAYRWASAYITISDSLYEAKFQNGLLELEKKYNEAENQKKIMALQVEKEKAQLTSRNNKLLAWLLGIAGAFFLLAACFIYFHNRNKRKLAEQREQNYKQQLTEARQQQQLQLTEALLKGEEKERNRLAGDLHDGLGGMLAGIKINLSRISSSHNNAVIANDLPSVIQQLDKSVNELRRIARNMMPESLLSSGLEASLKELCESFITDNLKLDFQAYNIRNDLPKETQATVFRIVQELVTNAVRHAQASNILLQCSQNENTFYITIEDDGKGFDSSIAETKKGIGLINVKNRVDYLRGKWDIESIIDEGTTINIEFNAG